MKRIGQVVGVIAVLALLAMPAAALASCWVPPMMSAGCPLCPAMNHQSAPASVQEAPAGASCCDLSSSKPTPARALQAPTTPTVLAPPTHAGVTAAVIPPARAEHAADQSSLSPPASPQAVLCTFLI